MWGRGRRKDRQTENDVPDETFAFLSRRQVQTIRALTVTAFAERGVEVAAHPDYLEAADGRQFGLGNLAANCANADRGEKDWPALIASHVRILTQTHRDVPLHELSPTEVFSRTYLRLIDVAALPEQAWEWFSYARPVCDTLREVLAFDSPETVAQIRDEDVVLFGLENLRDAGLTNLLTVPTDDHHVVPAEGFTVHVLTGESVYYASKLLILKDVLRRSLGEREYPNGVLVTAAFRHQLALVPIDGPAVPQAVSLLAGMAQQGYTEEAGPLSPHVYWWNEGLTRITSITEDGRLIVNATGAFGEMVERVIGSSPQG
jgi:hypothetical protein